MKCAQLQFIVVVIVGFLCETQCDLSLSGPKCGQLTCQPQEYCSKIDYRCHPCSEICNRNTHNFDEAACTNECQGYIHDTLYSRRDGGSPGTEDLRATVQRLQTMVAVSLTLTILVIIAFVTIVTLVVYQWTKKNDVTFANLCSKIRSKKSNTNDKSGNGVAVGGQVSGKPDLRLDMPTTGTQSEHSPNTLTTSISRRPAEDSALDYAYDNRAMSNSPSPNSKPHESNF